jgi:hypothetical protein
MYKKVEGQWIAIEGDFKKEIAKSKTETVSLFSRKISDITLYANILNDVLHYPGDMLWAYYQCRERKEASYIIATNISVETERVGADPAYLRSALKYSENAVVRGFYYFKRTGSRAVMQELTLEEMQKIVEE